MTLLKSDPARIYTRTDLEVFNLLEHPIWIFDLANLSIWFANTPALSIWDAETMDELISRDFKSDMSESVKRILLETLKPKMEAGEVIKEVRTFYPKGNAVTVRVTESAIRIEGGGISILCEAERVQKEDIDQSTVRGNEMIRHLPLAVCQYSVEGHVAYQNPEDLHVFGTPEEDNSSRNDFLSRFVDREIGRSALEQVQDGHDYKVDAECYTLDGSRWFSLAIRRTKDPVTSKHTILYSARDITEIIQARKDTTQAKLKSEFISVIAHELRTPLHQIIGYLDLLEETELTTIQRGVLGEIQSSGQLLLVIINDLLDYSKLESGKLQIENVAFELGGVHDGCLAAMATATEKKGLTVIKQISPSLPTKLIGDPIRLRQILLNLLSNAVKFTQPGGQITLRAKIVSSSASSVRNKVRIRFEVSDTGVGIAPDHQAKLFQKYQQANASVARNYGGTGLGLAICKGLVDTMGGTIGLESELDKGTTIFFEVPFDIASEPMESPCSGKPKASSTRTDSGESFRILLVEDNKINQKLAKRMLEGFGHKVTVADNGQLAVDELRRDCHYDLALVDIMMPVMDGIECTKHIRTVLGISKEELPIVGLTASYQYSDVEYYNNLGMNQCLGKPLRMAELRDAIATNIKRIKSKFVDQ